jgi:hypothetical protein
VVGAGRGSPHLNQAGWTLLADLLLLPQQLLLQPPPLMFQVPSDLVVQWNLLN